MRKLLTLLFMVSAACTTCDAQIAKWLVRPNYDFIHRVYGSDIYMGTNISKDTTFIWNMDGRELMATPHFIGPFRDGFAVVSSDSLLAGIVSIKGESVPVEEHADNYVLPQTNPLFADGLLVVKNKDNYNYLNTRGECVSKRNPFTYATPFHGKKAVVRGYRNKLKQKDAYIALIGTDMTEAVFIIKNKPVKPADVDFVSVPNDQHKSLLIVKNQAYIYDDNDGTVTPLVVSGPKNKSVAVTTRTPECLVVPMENGQSVVPLNRGKAYIDNEGLWVKLELDGEETLTFSRKEMESADEKVYTELARSTSTDASSHGINWIRGNETIELLPPQFDVVADMNKANAVVSLDNKYGILRLDKKSSFSLKLNEGKEIGFEHSRYASNIQATLPASVPYESVRIIAHDKTLCQINPVSRTGANTSEGNFLKYECDLLFPQGLTEERRDGEYSFSLEYDGFVSPLMSVKTKVWYVQQYVVEMEESSIDNGDIVLQVCVKKSEDNSKDDAKYWFNVTLTSDVFIENTYKKVNENVHAFRLSNLTEGQYNIWINVNEDGMPPIRFPYSITFTPSARKQPDRLKVEKQF